MRQLQQNAFVVDGKETAPYVHGEDESLGL